MTDATIIKRLQLAAQKDAARMHKIGLRAGGRWAERFATPAELARLDREVTATNFESDGAYARLYATLWPYGSPTPADIEVFWQRALGLDEVRIVLEPGFVAGFAAGAIRVWHRVAPKVRAAA